MITALAALSLLLTAAPATTPDPSIATARVQTADLDLHTTAGRAELDRRLQHAVNLVCPDATSIRELRNVQLSDNCRAATRSAIAQQRRAALAAAGIVTDQIASGGR